MYTDGLAAAESLVTALLERTRQAERPKAQPLQDERILRRLANGIEFEYVHDFDGQGIIHWIATNYNKERWSNPHLDHALHVSMSSVERGAPHELCVLEPQELWTSDVPASWYLEVVFVVASVFLPSLPYPL